MNFAHYRAFFLMVALSIGAIGLTVSFGQTVRRKPNLVPVPIAKTPPAAATKKVGAKPAVNVKEVASAEDAGAKFYDSRVMPILKKNCLHCHAGEKPSGKLSLTSREAILAGGNSGPAIDLEKIKDSLLLQAINYHDIEMPPSGKMAQDNIDVLTTWVEMGIPWSKPSSGATVVHHGPPQVNAENMKFWAFQPVKAPKVPVVKNKAWISNPIDNFVLAKLESKGLKPAQRADKMSLLRRATYDLLGLPPTPEQVRAFVNDKSPDSYEKTLDTLLASPQYGERWGRHWLDLVRYAETNSFERDDAKPFVWRYRDYVIKAHNDDKPYDQFVREQLAGDELAQVTPETIIATGYYRLGQWDDEPSDREQARADELDDIVATTSQAYLGMTTNCARCHDHKLDPIPQRDYYKFLSFFNNIHGYDNRPSNESNALRPISSPAEQERFAKETEIYKTQLTNFEKQLADIEKPVVETFSPVEKEEWKSAQNRIPLLKKRVPAILAEERLQVYIDLTEKRDALAKAPPKGLEQALAISEKGNKPEKTFLMMRGNPHSPGEEVQPGFLSILSPPEPQIPDLGPDAKTSGRRLALANWIASKDNPLTARVMVNRIWQHHFGRGIVRSPNNFGLLGTPATHPELLDWLASEFTAKGWKLKAMHKMIMMSSSYQMSSHSDKVALAKDPENDLFWRFDMRRLDAEEIRDSILFVNNSLNLKGGGPSIYPIIPKEVLAGQSRPGAGWGQSTPEEMARRSVYIHIKRSLAVPLLASFDAADTDFTCPTRFSTTQPTQALSMINSTFVNEQAQLFARYLQANTKAGLSAQVALGLSRVLQREPDAKEIERGLQLIRSLQQKHHIGESDALKNFCVVLLNLNEFIYLN